MLRTDRVGGLVRAVWRVNIFDKFMFNLALRESVNNAASAFAVEASEISRRRSGYIKLLAEDGTNTRGVVVELHNSCRVTQRQVQIITYGEFVSWRLMEFRASIALRVS